MSLEAYKQNYDEIVRLYDLAEELVSTVEQQQQETEKLAQLELVEPLVNNIEQAADVLTEEYVGLVESEGKSAVTAGKKVEGALRKLFSSILEYNRQTAERSERQYKNLFNLADPIVNQIKKATEKVISIFLNFIQLSIDRIVPKWEMEELKKQNIAIDLHNFSLNPK